MVKPGSTTRRIELPIRSTRQRSAQITLLACLFALIAPRNTTAQPPATPAPPTVPGHFVDTTATSGINFTAVASHTPTKYLIETMGSGVALFDYDNDGLLDIFFVNGAPLANPTPKGTIPQKASEKDWNRLYHQKKDGTFEDVTVKAGLQGIGYGMGVAVGDFDNDGYEDLYVTAYGGNRLYHNNGNGTFTDVTAKSGTAGSGWSTSAAWVDLDNDGLLDLVVLRYIQWDFDDVWCGEHREGYRSYCHPDIFKVIPPLVYHNDGKGHFTEISDKIGLNVPGKGLGITIADFDGDGHIDVAVANDSMFEFLYHNKGDGTFEERGLAAEIAVDSDGRTYAGMGIDAQDYNNDGLPDLVITNLANQRYALYRNNADGTFTYDSYMSGLAGMTLIHSGWGIHFLDYDNDGYKDLLIAQGHDLDTVELNFPQIHYREPMLLARNTGKGFVDVSADSGAVFQQPWVARGMAVGDIDNDGRIDAVVTLNDGPAHILHNETPGSNHWLTLALVGHKSNRDAIGALIKVTTPHGKQWVTVNTSGSYLSANDKRAHFGLGVDSTATAIDIRWPSGILQHLDNVKADQILKIDEPAQSSATAAQSSSANSAQTMEFSDKPNFTIAGVTDWTAVGGHGSDSSLRTSESLTHETLALKPNGNAGPRGDAGNEASESQLHRRAGDLDEKSGDPLSAVREYEQATKLDASEENYFAWGSELLLHRAVLQAQEIFRKGADAYPKSARMQTALGTALFAGARYDEAALRFCDASDLNPGDPTPFIFMGKIQIAAPDSLPCVEPKLASYAHLHPESATANYLYAMSLLKHQEQAPEKQATQQAQDLLTKAVTIDPKCSEAYLQLGILSASQRAFDNAIGFYTKAIAADPELADAHYRLGVAYDRTGRSNEAKQQFQIHDQLKRQQAEATERQRQEVKQFMVVQQGEPVTSPSQ